MSKCLALDALAAQGQPPGQFDKSWPRHSVPGQENDGRAGSVVFRRSQLSSGRQTVAWLGTEGRVIEMARYTVREVVHDVVADVAPEELPVLAGLRTPNKVGD
jgi:hypothetical protein